ncbi:radical SAM protein [Sulfurimonas sp. HSL-1716]|uniref:radical SAM protein n=1 Tax=Hydrocurvibacter sulfurireducens TaxID=3131937 RepID=UPI0031F765BF
MSDKYNMDGHKLLWHLDRVADWQQGKRIAPLHIDMGISTGCNQACRYCYGSIQGNVSYQKNDNMPTERVKSFFKDAKDAGVRSIALIGEGENTLHPDLIEIVEYGKSINMDLGMATNGMNIPRDKIKNLLESLVWIRVNLSASTPEKFHHIHRVSKNMFEHVLENIRLMVNMKKEYNLSTTIGIQMVMLNDNIQDVVRLAEIGRELGVDYFVVKPTSDTANNDLGSDYGKYNDSQDVFTQAESFSTDNYKVIIKWNKILTGGKKEYNVCNGTKFLLQISGNGNVFPCGHWFDIEKEKYLMGNIIENSFMDILASERYWQVQENMKNVNVHTGCESNCRHEYINRFLYNLQQKPDHINFI